MLQHAHALAHGKRLLLVMRHQNGRRAGRLMARATASRVSTRNPASRAENGSSSSSSRGEGASARAKATRCCSPPDSSCGAAWHNARAARPGPAVFDPARLVRSLGALQPEGNVVRHGKMRKQRALLRHIANAALLRPHAGPGEASISCPSRISPPSRRSKPGDQPQQRRLAAARSPQNRHQLPGRHLKTDPRKTGACRSFC